jgi:hypothetical protein
MIFPTATVFLVFLALTSIALIAIIARYLPQRITWGVAIALPAWLVYVGLLAWTGVIRNAALRPPGIVYVLLPAIAFILFFAVLSAAGRRIAQAFPLWLLLAFQVYRVGVELLFYLLWKDGLVARLLTFEGANVDILIGISAPLIAWFSTRGNAGIKLSLWWNAAGLLSLANIATRAILTSPGPLHLIRSAAPNLAFGTFPFTYIPGFFAPLAVLLHVLAIRRAVSRP